MGKPKLTEAQKREANASRQARFRARNAELRNALRVAGVKDPMAAIAAQKAAAKAAAEAKAEHDWFWSDAAIFEDAADMARKRFGWPRGVTLAYMSDDTLDPDLVPFDLTRDEADAYRLNL